MALRPVALLVPPSPALEVLRAAQTAEPPAHHDGQARAESLALLHAVGSPAPSAPALPGRGPSPRRPGHSHRAQTPPSQEPVSSSHMSGPLCLLCPRALQPLAGPGPTSPRAACAPHLCDVSTTERPSRTTARRLFQRKRRELGSMPVVGSSLGVQAACGKPSPCLPPGPAPAPPPLTRKTTAGSPTSATAVASFLLLPPL